MAAVIPNNIEVNILTFLTTTLDFRLRLFSNNYQPFGGTTPAALTQVTGGGYSPIPIIPADWAIIPSGGVSLATCLAKQFVFTGPGDNVYGYYVTDTTGATLIMVERFPELIVPFIPANNAKITITLGIACSGGE